MFHEIDLVLIEENKNEFCRTHEKKRTKTRMENSSVTRDDFIRKLKQILITNIEMLDRNVLGSHPSVKKVYFHHWKNKRNTEEMLGLVKNFVTKLIDDAYEDASRSIMLYDQAILKIVGNENGTCKTKRTEDVVRLNIGGTKFAPKVSVLKSIKNNYFDVYLSRRHVHCEQDVIFVDRDPAMFQQILDYMSGATMPDFIHAAEKASFICELEFYGLNRRPKDIVLIVNDERNTYKTYDVRTDKWNSHTNPTEYADGRMLESSCVVLGSVFQFGYSLNAVHLCTVDRLVHNGESEMQWINVSEDFPRDLRSPSHRTIGYTETVGLAQYMYMMTRVKKDPRYHPRRWSNLMYRFNTLTGVWNEESPVPKCDTEDEEGPVNHRICAVGHKIYVFPVTEGMCRMHEYSITSRGWTSHDIIPSTWTFYPPQQVHVIGAIIYLIGGAGGRTFDAFDTKERTLTSLPQIGDGGRSRDVRRFNSYVADGKIHVVCDMEHSVFDPISEEPRWVSNDVEYYFFESHIRILNFPTQVFDTVPTFLESSEAFLLLQEERIRLDTEAFIQEVRNVGNLRRLRIGPPIVPESQQEQIQIMLSKFNEKFAKDIYQSQGGFFSLLMEWIRTLEDKLNGIRAMRSEELQRHYKADNQNKWEKEKMNLHQDRQTLFFLEVGGTKFFTSTDTMRRIPDTMLSLLTKPDDFYTTEFIDRDPETFQYILNIMRDENSRRTLNVAPQRVQRKYKAHFEYYGLNSYANENQEDVAILVSSHVSKITNSYKSIYYTTREKRWSGDVTVQNDPAFYWDDEWRVCVVNKVIYFVGQGLTHVEELYNIGGGLQLSSTPYLRRLDFNEDNMVDEEPSWKWTILFGGEKPPLPRGIQDMLGYEEYIYVLSTAFVDKMELFRCSIMSKDARWEKRASPRNTVSIAACVLGEFMYVFGNNRSIEEYSFAENVWKTLKTTWVKEDVEIGFEIFPDIHVTAMDNQLYIMSTNNLGTFYRFDPRKDDLHFEMLATLPQIVVKKRPFVLDGKYHITGRKQFIGSTIICHYCYDVVTNMWIQLDGFHKSISHDGNYEILVTRRPLDSRSMEEIKM